jgi:hypothetical protein
MQSSISHREHREHREEQEQYLNRQAAKIHSELLSGDFICVYPWLIIDWFSL